MHRELKSQTSLSEFTAAAEAARSQGGGMVAVVRSLPCDHLTPIGVYQALFQKDDPSALLESVPQGQHVGRYSIIGVQPFMSFASRGNSSWVKFLRSGERRVYNDQPLEKLRSLLSLYTPRSVTDQLRFCGGAIGYFGFEATYLVEPTLVRPTRDRLGLPDIYLYFYDRLIVFDHVVQTLYLCASVPVAKSAADQQLYAELVAALNALEAKLQVSSAPLTELTGNGQPVFSNRSREEYRALVHRAKEYVASGDIFQVVLSQRFRTSFTGSSLTFYRHLRRRNPSPYMFHLNFGGDFKIIGASPEVMVDVAQGRLRLKPIAGTRRRGQTVDEDEALKRELEADGKEIAEHLMLVDLGRNDVGRNCNPGSVHVTMDRHVEFYSTVMHIVSEVTGKLAADSSPLLALLRCLPAGTLSGAPKVRACQRIAELEEECRGAYGGAIGILTASEIDTGILIRSAVQLSDQLYWQSGGGIVADSDAEAEYQETLAKGRAIGQLIDPNFGQSGEVEKEKENE